MHIRTLTFLTTLCGLLLTPVFAAAQAAVPAAEQGFNTDPRLKQNVTVHAEGIPVGDLLDLLSRKTGVSLKADPYVADDKVIAFTPPRPLRTTLVDLDSQEGLFDILRLIQVVYAAPLPLPMGDSTEIIQPRAGIDGGPSPQTVPILTAFLNSLRLAATPQNLRDFSVSLCGYTPAMLKAAQPMPPQNLSIHIEWKLGADNTILNSTAHTWYLWLPLQVPYDRSDKTRIEFIPSP